MTRTLVVLAHPDFGASRVNAALADGIRDLPCITVHDLYAAYPDLRIDVPHEQRLLADHERVILQFPFYWYSVPPLLKKWLDEVFERGWAYGPGGEALRGKRLGLVTTVGGGAALYRPDGLNRFPVTDLLLPWDATANLTGMDYEPPFVVHGAASIGDEELAEQVRHYRRLLTGTGIRAAA
ncbi:NAD(P)H-dependent oxidoreductase [Actinomadura graeca]|uniref:NAD(P)H-dependent oxidoreductase n=1 Tax=Actinomadura graeca TaxID=2750812 RepID=A0ABX8R1X2_9ACTN|nr:NAD(P)H-dependent oxidoreductase [Actinomadura graeca]QXJ23003.1 NAD(P)H-dependent oxidoreductase [Actinomadura graeca]